MHFQVVDSHAISELDGGRLSKVGPPIGDQPTTGELGPDVIQLTPGAPPFPHTVSTLSILHSVDGDGQH